MQTTIFQTKISERIIDMIDLLNDGRKSKDKYKIQTVLKKGRITIFSVENKDKDVLFNAVDDFGNIPKDFCVNFRNLRLLNHDLKGV